MLQLPKHPALEPHVAIVFTHGLVDLFFTKSLTFFQSLKLSIIPAVMPVTSGNYASDICLPFKGGLVLCSPSAGANFEFDSFT